MSQLSADDRLAIQDAIARYAHALDASEWDDFRALFTDDCRLDLGPMGVFEGAAGVRRFTDMMGSMGLTMRHFVTNIVVTGESDRAQAKVYVLAFTGEPGAQRPATGRYADELVKRGSRWLFQHRRVVIDVPKQ